MHIVVKADTEQKNEFLSKDIPSDIWVSFFSGEETIPGADAYFDLLFEDDGPAFTEISNKPVFVNAVITTANDLPDQYIRINAWKGFLQREIIEVACRKDAAIRAAAEIVLQKLNWKHQWVTDTPGMIAARVIAMIINEAYFGLGDEISSKAEMDTAMKLGTNYPYGPFEWAEKIGLPKIYQLLQALCKTDNRYAVAPELEKEIQST